MSSIRRSAIVRQSQQQMFDLVNDVEAYPQRFGWCEASQVLDRSAEALTARLEVRMGALRTAFTTRNTLAPPQRIDMALVDGPFSRLGGAWQFLPLGEHGCKVSLELDFEVAGRLFGTALAFGFQALADRMVDDFCREARRLHE